MMRYRIDGEHMFPFMGNSCHPPGHVADALGETLGVPADFRGAPGGSVIPT